MDDYDMWNYSVGLLLIVFLLGFVFYQTTSFNNYKEQQKCIFRAIDSGLSVKKAEYICKKKGEKINDNN